MKEQDLGPDELLPNISDLCASFQYAVARHLSQRLQRGFEFAERGELWTSGSTESESSDEKTLVVSGGVACNQMIRSSLQKVSCLPNTT